MSFEKNQDLEKLISLINNLLKPVEEKEIKNQKHDYSIPCILQIGSPRSGSTLFTQWVSSLGLFSGPTNFLSRFHEAPYVGALIYDMVTNPKYNYRDEFNDINKQISYRSITGKTSGFSAPHEFWYFWRKHFQFPDIPVDNKIFQKTADFETFNKEINLVQKVFDKPFVMKAHIANWYLESFSSHMQNTIYVHIHRNPIANIRSLMQARVNRNNDINKWFSFKPREFKLLSDMDPYHQVAGQIYFSEKSILGQRDLLGERYISFTYEEFCKDPKSIFDKLIRLVNKYSKKDIRTTYTGKTFFKISNPKTEFDDKKIDQAFKYFENKYGKLNYD